MPRCYEEIGVISRHLRTLPQGVQPGQMLQVQGQHEYHQPFLSEDCFIDATSQFKALPGTFPYHNWRAYLALRRKAGRSKNQVVALPGPGGGIVQLQAGPILNVLFCAIITNAS